MKLDINYELLFGRFLGVGDESEKSIKPLVRLLDSNFSEFIANQSSPKLDVDPNSNL